MTQMLELLFREIKIIMIKLSKSVVEKVYMIYDQMCDFARWIKTKENKMEMLGRGNWGH